MRAFIAIDVRDEIRKQLAETQRRLRPAAPDAKWARPEGIHLTLKFLGEISGAQAERVTDALAAIGSFEPFPIGVQEFGFFPHANKPRVFWAGVQAPPSLANLAGTIQKAMEDLGFEKDDRAYSPHLTLARFSAPRPQPALEDALAEIGAQSLGSFQASEFFLFESKLSAQGSIYRKVMRFPR
jgi:2'-5' RNA ligase